MLRFRKLNNYASGSVYVGEFKDSERCRSKNAQVAQSVEQRTENPRVGGSIPPPATLATSALARSPQGTNRPKPVWILPSRCSISTLL